MTPRTRSAKKLTMIDPEGYGPLIGHVTSIAGEIGRCSATSRTNSIAGTSDKIAISVFIAQLPAVRVSFVHAANANALCLPDAHLPRDTLGPVPHEPMDHDSLLTGWKPTDQFQEFAHGQMVVDSERWYDRLDPLERMSPRRRELIERQPPGRLLKSADK